MQISVGKDAVHFHPIEVKNVTEFLDHALTKNWSPSIFKNNYRNKENFLKAEMIAIDIDNDESQKMSLEQAIHEFKDYKHLIMPSRSHQKLKNGEVKDRFRVLLFLTRPIETEQEFYATWFSLQERWPAIDPSCKDPSRFFYPSTECVSKNMKGKTIDPVEPKPSNEVDKISESSNEPSDGFHGELSRKTLKFMLDGARPGNRHRELYKAARDYHQNNYPKERFIADLEAMIQRTGNWAQDHISAKDRTTIDDAFRVDPKHAARYAFEKALLFEPVSEVLNSTEKFEWLVDGLLSVGGVSILAGDPKAGKSTLVRQLVRAVSRKERFLGRKVKQGQIYYMALEEQRSLLKNQFRALGINENDAIKIHVGSPLSADILESLEEELSKEQVALLVIDTFLLGLRIKEPNSYSEVNDAITPYRDLARDTGTHILFIHHTNKTGIGSNSISGSKAIHGAVDCAMILKAYGKERIFSSNGRGVKPFVEHQLLFDDNTQTYCLGQSGGFNDETEF